MQKEQILQKDSQTERNPDEITSDHQNNRSKQFFQQKPVKTHIQITQKDKKENPSQIMIPDIPSDQLFEYFIKQKLLEEQEKYYSQYTNLCYDPNISRKAIKEHRQSYYKRRIQMEQILKSKEKTQFQKAKQSFGLAIKGIFTSLFHDKMKQEEKRQ